MLSYSVFDSQFCLGFIRVSSSYLKNLFGCYLVGLLFSSCCSSFFKHIHSIFCVRSHPKMIWINAFTSVACVAHMKSFWDMPSMYYPTQTVGINSSVYSKNTDIYAAVSRIRKTPSPIPAGIGFFDLGEEPSQTFVRQILSGEPWSSIVFTHSKYCLRATLSAVIAARGHFHFTQYA